VNYGEMPGKAGWLRVRANGPDLGSFALEKRSIDRRPRGSRTRLG
jgi:hypothetical protein